MTVRRRRKAIDAIVFVLLLAVGGCAGDDGLPREPIAGRVSLDGEPLDLGSIQFMAADLSGPITGGGATITDGSYKIPRDQGLVPGVYRVMIFAADAPSGATGTTAPPVQTDTLTKSRIPDRYNTKSDLKIEVTKGGDNSFDFEMKSS